MIIKLETIGETIDLPDGLGVISFDDFDGLSRCATSLLGEGEPGIALYRGERKIKPKGILLIDSLIELPFEDRRLVGAYASRMAAEVEAYEPLATKANEIRMFVDELIAELGASLRTDPIGDTERDIKSFAKWLSLTPRREPGSTLLKRFLSFMDYVCDTGLRPPIAVIGLIDKLNPTDVLEITRKARHEGLELLFLEYREVNTTDPEIPVWHIDRTGFSSPAPLKPLNWCEHLEISNKAYCLTVRLSDDPVAVRFFQNSHNHPVSGRKEDGFPKSSEPFLPLNQLFSFSSCSYAALASRCRFSGFAGTALRAVTCLSNCTIGGIGNFTGTALGAVT